MRFAAVIFDMDGLLLDSERLALEAFNAACAHFGLGDHAEVFMRCIGTNEAMGAEVLREGLQDKVDHRDFNRIWQARYLEATTGTAIALKAGVLELLDHLREAGVPAAVATSTSTARATHKLGNAGILDRFELVVGGDQVERSKPHPDIFVAAARRLGVPPEKCLALEDSDNGVRAALRAGMTVIQVPDLMPPSPALRMLGHIVLDSLHDVRQYEFGIDASGRKHA
ncbi:MAG TPA: HAD family phosphatase [Burkholderiales bacterium]|nr:HAD family phosphatase [Burkholderiales bacterium]